MSEHPHSSAPTSASTSAHDAVTGDAAVIARNVAAIRARMDVACARAHRPADSVRLLPVTKTLPIERVRAAVAAGLHTLGENKVQEAREKAEALAGLDVQWSIIGHLQTNKARYVVRFAHEFQALDRVKVAEALHRRLELEGRSGGRGEGGGRTLDVYVQVNTSAEPSKFGLEPGAALDFARELSAFPTLRVRGLMTLAIFSSDDERVRRCFRLLREVQERLRQDGPADLDWSELSMGMSGDFEAAIEEGATVVRVGQAIFGPRPFPDNYYWPGAAGTTEPHG